MRGQRDEFEAKLLTQITELNLIRSSLSELEKSHHTLRTQYDDEMTRMRAELHASRQGQGGGIPPPSHPSSAAGMGSVSQAQTPSQAPAQPPGLSSGGGGYGGDPYFSRERDRDRERDREREYRERERGPIDTRDPKRMKTDSQRMKGGCFRDAFVSFCVCFAVSVRLAVLRLFLPCCVRIRLLVCLVFFPLPVCQATQRLPRVSVNGSLRLRTRQR
ncbi:hypothetical protein BDV98DRAFT_368905 [Pterulicium gracile]|uniref:Transcriptional repressor Tup1 N-terminal domain-containing protein n=1 Tax=Pterulicium gracile TaxID=1884261 RepID=A0A5C3Q188_9AGAR|nr:hypothetical protein BDV98DRAFT_368905 [Pterula gracilis]